MKVITGGRGTGKTAELVEMALSLAAPSVIVVSTRQEVTHILEIIQHKNPNNNLIHVITVSQLINDYFFLHGLPANTPVFFDEAAYCLQALCRRDRGNVEAITFSNENNSNQQSLSCGFDVVQSLKEFEDFLKRNYKPVGKGGKA